MRSTRSRLFTSTVLMSPNRETSGQCLARTAEAYGSFSICHFVLNPPVFSSPRSIPPIPAKQLPTVITGRRRPCRATASAPRPRAGRPSRGRCRAASSRRARAAPRRAGLSSSASDLDVFVELDAGDRPLPFRPLGEAVLLSFRFADLLDRRLPVFRILDDEPRARPDLAVDEVVARDPLPDPL